MINTSVLSKHKDVNMVNQNKKISIIVAVFNIESFITQCLESIRKQTYQNIEVICINDGSTDSSGKICDQFSILDSRFKVIHQNNRGAAAARNAGIRYATGDIIGIIDGDDWIEPMMYEQLIEKMCIDELDIVSCSYCYDYSNRQVKVINKKKIPDKPISGRKMLYYIFNRDQYKALGGYHCTRLIKRELIEGNNILYDVNFKSHQDVIFLTNCHLVANKVGFIEGNFYHYRQRVESLGHSSEIRISGLWAVKGYEEIINILKQNNVSNLIINYVRRFKVYNAGEILKLAIKAENIEKIEELKIIIKQDFLIYAIMNWKHPKRIIEMYQLYKNN